MKTMKHFYTLILTTIMSLLFTLTVQSQVRIDDNTSTCTTLELQDSSSILELSGDNRGLLLPRVFIADLELWGLGTDGTQDTNTAGEGMIVYDTVLNGIYYWDGKKWNTCSGGSTDCSACYVSIVDSVLQDQNFLTTLQDSIDTRLDSVIVERGNNLIYYIGGVPVDTTIVKDTSVFLSSNIVYNDTAPVTWQDLDLSPIVGSNPASVILKVEDAGFACYTSVFRPNGESGFASPASGSSYFPGCSVTLLTDSNGVIEWRTMLGVPNTVKITIVGYIK